MVLTPEKILLVARFFIIISVARHSSYAYHDISSTSAYYYHYESTSSASAPTTYPGPSVFIYPTISVTSAPITVTFNQSTYSVNEDDGPAQPVLVLSNPSSTDITVQVRAINNTAIGRCVDYNSGPYTVTFPAGVTSIPFDVPIYDDNTLEGDEDFDLIIICDSLPDYVTRSDTGQATVTIVDNDPVTVTFEQTTYKAYEDYDSTQLILVLSNPSSTDITVYARDTQNTATRGVDYDPVPYTVTIPAGITWFPFNIQVYYDNLLEDDEYFSVAIRSGRNITGVSVGDPDNATVIILNEDFSNVKFSKSTYSINEGNKDKEILLDLILNYFSLIDITIQVQTSDDTATGGVDYGSGLYNVTIPAKMIGTSFSVPIIDDNILENDERFSLRIVSNSLPEYVIVNHPSLTTVSIRDDDAVKITFSQSTYSVNEDTGPAQPVLVLSNPSSTNITVQVRDTQNTATRGGVDYDSGPHTVTFPVGQTRVALNIPINDDAIVEDNEKFTLFMNKPLPNRVTVRRRDIKASFTIIDNDLLVVEFGSDEFVGSESLGHVEVVVIISGGSSITPIEVVVTPSEQSPVSARGSGVDFDSNPITIIFGVGEVSKRVNISVSYDEEVEGEETFDITLFWTNNSPQLRSGKHTSVGKIYDYNTGKGKMCPTLSDPDNGKVVLLSDGKTAIFTCESSFIILGEAFSYCDNGKWKSVPPKCVSPTECANKQN